MVNAMDVTLPGCAQCGNSLVDSHGVFNLTDHVSKVEERKFYDREYSNSEGQQPPLSLETLQPAWKRNDAAQNRLLRDAVGNLSGKAVLLIGNGASRKELTFLNHAPCRLVYTDLSANASRIIKGEFDFAPYAETVRFAAVDAEKLPFVDESFDVVYGHAMVHHLPNVNEFLRGAYRVLKPGGRAVFMDDAYSPIWHHSKQTWLKPLMKYSHQRTGISPEDYRFSMSGGFKESDLGPMIVSIGAVPYFQRSCLLDYLWTRAIEKLLPKSMYGPLTSGTMMDMMVGIDRALSRFPQYRNNQIRLIWGFAKP